VRSIGARSARAALLLVPLFVALPAAQRASSPPDAGVDVARLAEIPPLVEQAIADKKLPGAVVLVGRGDRVVYERAIGRRAVEPAPEPMTLDTIFDVASLTKVIATTTSVMKLVEDGRVRHGAERNSGSAAENEFVIHDDFDRCFIAAQAKK